MKKHPAKNARFLAGVAGAAGVVVVGAGVLDNAIVKVDYSQTIAGISTAPETTETTIDLTGSATTTTTGSSETEQSAVADSAPTSVEPLAPTTTQAPKPVRTTKSKAS